MQVRLIHLDGKLPNLALMKLSHWHKSQGDEVSLTTSVQPSMFETRPDKVYASAIFKYSLPRLQEVRTAWPQAMLGGTGTGYYNTVEEAIGEDTYEHYDYSIYPGYPWSIGFTQRGCRQNCTFCVVPKKEGKPRAVNSIDDIWRPDTERKIVLLDNDFFGQPKPLWQERINEIRDGGFRVSFNQGINIRLIDDEAAEALASIQYRDDQFERRRLYTAWDNLGQERIFFQGLDRLERAGIPAKHIMVYMLTGYRDGETMEEVRYRHQKLVDAGCKPYPMVHEKYATKELKEFQRYVIGRYAEFVPWQDYDQNAKGPRNNGEAPETPPLWHGNEPPSTGS